MSMWKCVEKLPAKKISVSRADVKGISGQFPDSSSFRMPENYTYGGPHALKKSNIKENMEAQSKGNKVTVSGIIGASSPGTKSLVMPDTSGSSTDTRNNE